MKLPKRNRMRLAVVVFGSSALRTSLPVTLLQIVPGISAGQRFSVGCPVDRPSGTMCTSVKMKMAVAEATPDSVGIYRGRSTTQTTFSTGNLQPNKTYFWRIDGADSTDPQNVWKGKVWQFTTKDLIISHYPVNRATRVDWPVNLSWVPSEPAYSTISTSVRMRAPWLMPHRIASTYTGADRQPTRRPLIQVTSSPTRPTSGASMAWIVPSRKTY